MKKKRNIGKTVLTIVFIVMILCSLGTALYFGFIYKTPMQLFKISIDEVNKNLAEKITTDSNNSLMFGVGKATYEITDTAQDEKKIIQELNGIDIDYKFNIDNNMGRYRLDIESSKDNEAFFNSMLYSTNGKTYIYLKDFYDKYLLIDEKDDAIKLENSKTIIDVLLKDIKNSLKEEYFDVNLVKEKNMTGYAMSLTKKQQEELVKDVFSKIKKEKKITSIISIDDIENLEEKINDSISDNIFRITIFTKGIKKEFCKIEIMATNKNGFTFSLNKESDNTYTFDYKFNKGYEVNGKITKDAQKGSNGRYSNYAITFETSNNIKFTSKIENTISYDKDFKEIVIENPINYINMNDDEKNEIKNTIKTFNSIATFEDSFRNYFNIDKKDVNEQEVNNNSTEAASPIDSAE